MLKKTLLSMLLAVTAFSALAPSGASADYVERSGQLRLLRIHDVGTGYGPSTDFIDVEVVISFSNDPSKAYGFKLRNDTNSLTHQAMVELLREAYQNNWTVVINADIPAGKNHGVLNRVWVRR